MTEDWDSKDKNSELRRRAESSFSQKAVDAVDISTLSQGDVQNLVHELQVHQIELEMQNEELRQSQIKLEELKDGYLDLYDFAPVGYITLNEKGLIAEANLTAVSLLGEERQKLINSPLSRFVSKEFGDVYYLYLQQVFETQSKETCEILLARKDDTQIYAQLESVAVQDENGQFSQCRTIIADITERKQAEFALMEKTDALEISNKDLEQFAYVAAHDLREPLIGVAAYLKLLERRIGNTLDNEARRYLSRSLDTVIKMDFLIHSLLEYSRVSEIRREPEATDTNACLSQALANLRTAIRESGATVMADSLPTVMADTIHITQLFQNLIANAIKFRGNMPLNICVGVESTDSECQFSVIDNGLGIERPHFARIFKIFQRGDNLGAPGGTGIGLATCKKIVERYGGRIWVESEPGKGSMFRFTLPLVKIAS